MYLSALNHRNIIWEQTAETVGKSPGSCAIAPTIETEKKLKNDRRSEEALSTLIDIQ